MMYYTTDKTLPTITDPENRASHDTTERHPKMLLGVAVPQTLLPSQAAASPPPPPQDVEEPSTVVPQPPDLDAMSREELQAVCTTLGCSSKGNRRTLIGRIRRASS